MNGSVAYLDTSAVVKLLMREPETANLRRQLRRWPRRVSSALLTVELLRTVKRAGLPHLLSDARHLIGTLHLIRLDDELLDRAAWLDPPNLRSLDAIHLATALSLGTDLGAMVTYDRRMAAGVEALGLPLVAPT